MDIEDMLSMLESKDTKEAFLILKELEKLSENSQILYKYIDKFTEMIFSEKYVIRVRGFRLFCKQARCDTDNIIDKNIKSVLIILKDEKPTAVRQALAALHDIVIYKNKLRSIIKEEISKIDYLKYKDTMHSLILKDIKNLINLCDNIDK